MGNKTRLIVDSTQEFIGQAWSPEAIVAACQEQAVPLVAFTDIPEPEKAPPSPGGGYGEMM